MKDTFGNYIVQNLIEIEHEETTKAVLERALTNPLELSTNKYSCRVVQKLLAQVSQDQVLAFLNALCPRFIEDCIFD
jgi:pumilio RNA-binding family